MPAKVLIFDSSSLISLTMNGLLDELKGLKKLFKGNFIITEDVKREIIDTPIKIKRFELEALKLEALMKEKVLEMPEVLGVKSREIDILTKDIIDSTNNLFEARRKPVHLIDLGEASCMALNQILAERGDKSVLVVDERTTRLLIEKPQNLLKIMEGRLHMNMSQINNFREFRNFRIIRSSELIYVAYKKGLTEFSSNDPRALDALLYALKFKGCAISDEEIAEIKRM